MIPLPKPLQDSINLLAEIAALREASLDRLSDQIRRTEEALQRYSPKFGVIYPIPQSESSLAWNNWSAGKYRIVVKDPGLGPEAKVLLECSRFVRHAFLEHLSPLVLLVADCLDQDTP